MHKHLNQVHLIYLELFVPWKKVGVLDVMWDRQYDLLEELCVP
jgi:hypothetical protein